MPNFTVSTDVDSFMQGADFAAMRTSLGVKSETDTEAADNRRAFSGGLAFDGGSIDLNNTSSASGAKSYHFVITTGSDINTDQVIYMRTVSGVPYSVLGIRSNKVQFRWYGNNSLDRTIEIEANTTYAVTASFDGVDSSLLSVNSTEASLSAVNTSGSSISGERIGLKTSGSSPFTGSISDVAIFNTALTSAQAAEIYRDGLQPWLAANPEYRKGEDRYASDYSAGLDGGTGINVIATGDNDGVTDGTTSYNDVLKVVADTANNSKRFNFPNSTRVKLNDPDIYSFKFKYFIPSGTNITSIRWFIGGTGVSSFFGGSPSFSDTGTWVQVERVGTITSSATVTGALWIYLNGASVFTGDGVNDIVYIRDVELVKLGALANLPLDDDSRQLKDISGNRNDATASEAGVNHLIQKNTHSFRDDHADSTGGSYLIANSDILAENEVITGVTMDGRFYAATGTQDLTKRRIKLVASGSHINVKRSNGTTDDAANATTHPASTTDFAVNVLTQRI